MARSAYYNVLILISMYRKDIAMKTSTEFGSLCNRVPHEKALELLGRAGFDAFDLSLFEMARYDWRTQSLLETDSPFVGADALKYARRLKQVAQDNGLVCNQSHAPFPVCCKGILDLVPLALECSAEAGASICIVHPDNNKTPEENAEMFEALLPTAKACHVKIATENMWNWNNEEDHAASAACSDHDNFLRHIEAVNDPYLVACVDIGHAEMRGLGTSAAQMIRTLGSHVQALHMHDTDCHHDNHQLPLTMKIDYDPILRALKEVNYQGYFTLEADTYLSAFDDEHLFVGVQNMQHAARELADRFERLSV